MTISIELDREHDQLYILLRAGATEKGSVAKSARLTADVVADFDAEGRLIGLDVSDTSKVLGLADLEQLAVAVAVGGSKRAKA